MTDLGLSERQEDDTGNVDLDELRAALARSAERTPSTRSAPGSDGTRAGASESGEPAAPGSQTLGAGTSEQVNGNGHRVTGCGPADGEESRRSPSPPAPREMRSATRPGPTVIPPPSLPLVGSRTTPPRREVQRRRNRRRRRHTLVALLVLGVLAAAITGGFLIWRHDRSTVADFPAGTSAGQVVVHVQDSDSRTDVAGRLADAGVVASARAFLDATTNDADVARIRPGYYRLSSHQSATAAADALVDPVNRVGQLRIIPGRQLADLTPRPGATAAAGYITDITKAACVPIDGAARCFTADQLWTVAESADPAGLNVPEWAIDAVRAAPDPRRRLEGLIRPGDYNVPPTADPAQALAAVLSQSTALWSTSDVVAGADAQGVTTYQAAIIASLVEREARGADMGKAAQVIYNRYQERMRLQLDSTINYAFGRTQVATTAADRATASPYNTYLHDGLPPTPIDSPGDAALTATLNPTDGPWLYFVIIDKQGDSCFSITLAEHEKCTEQARRNGVFDQ